MIRRGTPPGRDGLANPYEIRPVPAFTGAVPLAVLGGAVTAALLGGASGALAAEPDEQPAPDATSMPSAGPGTVTTATSDPDGDDWGPSADPDPGESVTFGWSGPTDVFPPDEDGPARTDPATGDTTVAEVPAQATTAPVQLVTPAGTGTEADDLGEDPFDVPLFAPMPPLLGTVADPDTEVAGVPDPDTAPADPLVVSWTDAPELFTPGTSAPVESPQDGGTGQAARPEPRAPDNTPEPVTRAGDPAVPTPATPAPRAAEPAVPVAVDAGRSAEPDSLPAAAGGTGSGGVSGAVQGDVVPSTTGGGAVAAGGSSGADDPIAAARNYALAGAVPSFVLGTGFRLSDPSMGGSLAKAATASATRVGPGVGQDFAVMGGLSQVEFTGDADVDRFLHGQVVDTAVVTAADMTLRRLNPLINAWGERNPTVPGSAVARGARLDSGLPAATLALIGPTLTTANTLIDTVETEVFGFETGADGRPVPTTNAQYYADGLARDAALGATIGTLANVGLRNPQWAQQVGETVLAAPERIRAAVAPSSPTPTPPGSTDVPTAPRTTPDATPDAVVNRPSTPTGPAALADDVDNAAALATPRPTMPRWLGVASTLAPFVVPPIQQGLVRAFTKPAPEPDGVTAVVDATRRTVIEPLQNTFGSATVQQTGAVLGDAVVGCASGLTTRANCGAGAAAAAGIAFRDKTTLGRDATRDIMTSDGTVADAATDNAGIIAGQAGNVLDVGLNGLSAGLATISAPLVPLHEMLQTGSVRPVGLEERLGFLAEEPSVRATGAALQEYGANIGRSWDNAGTVLAGTPQLIADTAAQGRNLLQYGDSRGPTRSGRPWCGPTTTSGCIRPGSEDPGDPNSMGVLVKGPAVPGSPYYEEAKAKGIAGQRFVGPLILGEGYVGDGTPGGTLEAVGRNLVSDPTYLPRQISGGVDRAIDRFTADPVGTVLRWAPAVFR